MTKASEDRLRPAGGVRQPGIYGPGHEALFGGPGLSGPVPEIGDPAHRGEQLEAHAPVPEPPQSLIKPLGGGAGNVHHEQLQLVVSLAVLGVSAAALYGCYQGYVGVDVIASQQDMYPS